METDMKKLLSVFGILVLCLTFAGCDKDKEEVVDYGSLLVGNWEMVDTDIDDEDFNFRNVEMYWVFKKAGSVDLHMIALGLTYSKMEGTYVVNGNKVTIDGDEEYGIEKLTSSELILKRGVGTITFKKRTSLPDFDDYIEVE
jgi:uncharacterized protein (TIGR03066 family)